MRHRSLWLLCTFILFTLLFTHFTNAKRPDKRHSPKFTVEDYLKLDRTQLHKCRPPEGERAIEMKDAKPFKLTHYFQPLWPTDDGFTIPESGYMVYEVLLTKNGEPYCFELLESNLRHWKFRDATEKAIRKWRYEAPRDKEGLNVFCYTYVLVKY